MLQTRLSGRAFRRGASSMAAGVVLAVEAAREDFIGARSRPIGASAAFPFD